MAYSDIDLAAPFDNDVILEVRRSKMKAMPGLKIQSGIDKTPCEGRIAVSFLGLEEDEHDLVFHGGRDKAVHGYCSSHYPAWQAEYPEAASRFHPGAFGENLVTRHMNERNVCIGDIVQVGPVDVGPLLQVSLPRQPCFKLNHRFQIKQFAPKTYLSSRTGWYYRVLKEGTVAAGDSISLVERRWPTWTIERVQEYLHRSQENHEMNKELAAIEAMGEESRGNFRNRVTRHEARKKREAAGEEKDEGDEWRDYKVVEKKQQTDRIASFVLEAVDAKPDNESTLRGAHARLKLPGGLLRSYSIVSGNGNRFELGIALDADSKGGSRFMHAASVGDTVSVGSITGDIAPAGSKSNHVFIAGGVGITAFLSLLDLYSRIHWSTTLHYAVRSTSDIPFRERIEGLGEAVRIYDALQGQRMDLAAILGGLSWNSQVYVCGPQSMMDEVRRVCRELGISDDDVHLEAFQADTSGDPFEAEIVNRGGRTLQVGAEETLLEVLKRNFEGIPSSCEVGNCGTCRISLKAGRVDHRGTALTKEDMDESMLSCVSRGIGRIVVEI